MTPRHCQPPTQGIHLPSQQHQQPPHPVSPIHGSTWAYANFSNCNPLRERACVVATRTLSALCRLSLTPHLLSLFGDRRSGRGLESSLVPRTGVTRQLTPFCGRSRERERAAIWDATIEVRLIESHETKAVRPISLPLFDPLDAPSNPLVKEATKFGRIGEICSGFTSGV